MNGYKVYRGFYITQHDCVVDLIAAAVKEVSLTGVNMYKHSCVMPGWFNVFHDLFCNIFNTIDVVFLGQSQRMELILEISCVFDLYMDEAFSDKLIKYQSSVTNIS